MKRVIISCILVILVTFPTFVNATGGVRTFRFSAPWGGVQIIIDEKAIKALQIEDIKINYTPPVSHYEYVPQHERGIVHQPGFDGWQRTGGTGGIYGVSLITTGQGNGRALVELFSVTAMGKRQRIDTESLGYSGLVWMGKIGIFNFFMPWNEMRIHWAPKAGKE